MSTGAPWPIASKDPAPGWPCLIAAAAALWLLGRLLDVATRAGSLPRAGLAFVQPALRSVRSADADGALTSANAVPGLLPLCGEGLWQSGASLLFGVVLAFSATAAYSAERHHDLHIVIDAISHSRQRYPTVGGPADRQGWQSAYHRLEDERPAV